MFLVVSERHLFEVFSYSGSSHGRHRFRQDAEETGTVQIVSSVVG